MTAWHTPLPTPAEMSAWDSAAVRYGMRGEMLMENASREVLAVLHSELDQRGMPLPGLHVLLVAGPGNNGGDAAALARHLLDAGADVLLCHTKPRDRYMREAGFHFRLAARCGVPMRMVRGPGSLAMANGKRPHIIIDGLLGTGFSGELRPAMRDLIKGVHSLAEDALIFAIDIPSGLDGLSGRPSPLAVQAHATITFEAPKLGMVQPESRPYLGRLHVRSIGIPLSVRQEHPPAQVLLTKDVASLLPSAVPALHKGTAGMVLVVGGSEGLTGAPLLAAMGALRGGAGLVSIACPGGLGEAIKAGNPDVMILPLGSDRRWAASLAGALRKGIANGDALAVGPGMGREADAGGFLQQVVTRPRPPTVFDADALTLMSRDRQLLPALSAQDVLTPHPGEAARLLGWDIAKVQHDRPAACRALALLTPAAVVLKGAATLICQQDNWGGPGEADSDGPMSKDRNGTPLQLYVSPHCRPSLAVGGSGDVLAGLVAALLGMGLPALEAACLAVYWHGQAGAVLEMDYPFRGNTASDIASAIPRAICAMRSAVSCNGFF